MNTNNLWIKIEVLIFVLVLAFGGYVYFFRNEAKVPAVAPVAEQPTVFVNPKADLITVESPIPNSEVANTFTVTGKARGNWFFEASFPIFLTDWDGKIIAQGIAKAQGDWMTSEFVPFTAELSYKASDISGQYSKKGTLILKKDNPSGLPEHDDVLEIPVLLK